MYDTCKEGESAYHVEEGAIEYCLYIFMDIEEQSFFRTKSEMLYPQLHNKCQCYAQIDRKVVHSNALDLMKVPNIEIYDV